jgi:hypothetical protein
MFSGRAWRVVRFGDPKAAVELQEMTWGEPSPGQVLIRTRAAGAGLPDAMMTAGHFPLLGEPPFGLRRKPQGKSSPCRRVHSLRSAIRWRASRRSWRGGAATPSTPTYARGRPCVSRWEPETPMKVAMFSQLDARHRRLLRLLVPGGYGSGVGAQSAVNVTALRAAVAR